MPGRISPPRRKEREELAQNLGVLGVFAVKIPLRLPANTRQGDHPNYRLLLILLGLSAFWAFLMYQTVASPYQLAAFWQRILDRQKARRKEKAKAED